MRGIYKITNTINNKMYIGETLDIEKRWSDHKRQLNNYTHKNKMLQSEWKQYGGENFKFEAIKVLGDDIKSPIDKYVLVVCEDIFIRKYNTLEAGYNIEDTLTEYLLGNMTIGKDLDEDRKVFKRIISLFRKNNDLDLKDTLVQDLLNNTTAPYKSIKRYSDSIACVYGTYFFFNYEEKLLSDAPSALLARFLYLCCHMTYKNYIATKREKLVTTKEFKNIIKLSNTDAYKLRKNLINYKLITFTANETFRINRKYSSKGSCTKYDNNGIRIFSAALKELYDNSTPREHAQLSLLYRMIPYLHFKTNICCKNPSEPDISRIEPYTLMEISMLIHESNITRFKRKFLAMTVYGEPVLKIIRFKGKRAIAINPRICFKGKYNDLTILKELDISFSNTVDK
jgi:group I intron endonuclease